MPFPVGDGEVRHRDARLVHRRNNRSVGHLQNEAFLVAAQLDEQDEALAVFRSQGQANTPRNVDGTQGGLERQVAVTVESGMAKLNNNSSDKSLK